MRNGRHSAVVLLLLLTAAPCFAHHMALVVNKENRVENVTSAHLAKIFRAEIKKWPDGKDIILVLHKNSNGEMETLLRLNRISEDDLQAMLISHKDSIVRVDSDADVLKTVQSTPGAVGLVDVRSVNNAIKIVKVDGKLPMEDGYLPH